MELLAFFLCVGLAHLFFYVVEKVQREYFPDSLTPQPVQLPPPPQPVQRVFEPAGRAVQDGTLSARPLKGFSDLLELRFPVADWNRRGYRLELVPETLHHRETPRLRIRDIQLGAPSFDPMFYIRSNDAPGTRTLLRAMVRRRIYELYRLWGNNQLSLRVDRLFLVIQKARERWETGLEGSRIDRLIDGGLWLRDEVRDFLDRPSALAVHPELPAGVVLIEGGLQVRPEAASCPVCGEGMYAPEVSCRECGVPAHRECWEFAGICPTFGCMSVVYRVG